MTGGLPGRHRSVYKVKRRKIFGHKRSRMPSFSRSSGLRGHGRSGHGRRWPKRTLIGVICLVVLLILFAAGSYIFLDVKLGDIHREQVSALTPVKSGQAENVLLIGSDSRQCETSKAQASAFGSKTTVTGQRSDTIVVTRFLSGGRVEMLSIPRDLWVPIAGADGSAKINAAFNNGPNPLVQTIQRNFGIPINHVVMLNLCGVSTMVNALGGVYMDFPDPVRDAYTGLDVTKTGCQLVDGAEALQIARSRHLYYYADGQWNYDGMSDFSRIKRQQNLFHAILDRLHSVVPNVFEAFSFVDAAARGIAVDSGFSSNSMLALGWDYHSLSASRLYSSTLPTSEAVIDGQDVLLPVPEDKAIIHAFLAGNTAGFTVSLVRGDPPVSLMSDIVNPNTLSEPWNPVPC